jgi:hypothetical protein
LSHGGQFFLRQESLPASLDLLRGVQELTNPPDPIAQDRVVKPMMVKGETTEQVGMSGDVFFGCSTKVRRLYELPDAPITLRINPTIPVRGILWSHKTLQRQG